MIRLEKIKKNILIMIGFLACVCQWDSSTFPKSILFFLCLIPPIWATNLILKNRYLKNLFAFKWYGLFYLFVCFSLTYTVNNIDTNDIIRRCSLAFILIFSASQIIESIKDYKLIFKGLIAGTYATLFVTFIREYSLIGLGRIGTLTCGAATAFSEILLIGFCCSLLLNIINPNKWLKISIVLFFLGILLSGSRMPLIMSGVIFIGVKLLTTGFSKKIIKTVFLISCIIPLIGFAIMNNTALYNIIGERIETMIDSVRYGVDKDTDSSLDVRSQMKQEALKLWIQSPIYGHGVNSFWILSPVTNGRASSHSGWTEILCSFGIIGFILFYWPFLYPLKTVLKKNKIIRVISFVLLCFFIMEWQGGCFDSSSHILFFFFLFSLLLEQSLKNKNIF